MDPHLTLARIEGRDGGEPTFSSHLVQTCHRLRHKPLVQFTAEDFRILLGQDISVDVLLPLALTVLEEDPLAEGDYYPGDLLVAALRVAPAYFIAHPEVGVRLRVVYRRARTTLQDRGRRTTEIDEAAAGW